MTRTTSSLKNQRQARLHSLYLQIGQESGLEKILQDLYQRLSHDLMIGYFFEGKDLQHIIHQQKNFLMRAMGAQESYVGQSPGKAHQKLPPIWKGHFDRRLRILEETLRDHGLTAEDIRIWIDFENSFRKSIQSTGP